jgi:hypothetical protein
MSITFDVNCAKAGLWIEIYFLETISGLNCNRPSKATSVRTEAWMSSLARPGLPSEKEVHRLPIGQAAVVIVALAVLSWAVLIAIIMGLRALL